MILRHAVVTGTHQAWSLSIYITRLVSLGLGFIQLPTQMSIRSTKIMLLRSRVRPMRRADNLAAICELICRRRGILNISQSYRPPLPVTGIVLLFIQSWGTTMLMGEKEIARRGGLIWGMLWKPVWRVEARLKWLRILLNGQFWY
jgi:hypothetical protein